MPCSAARRKGPNAVRTGRSAHGHTATSLSLDLRGKPGQRKTQDLGPWRSSDGAGAGHLRKNSKSAIKLLQMVLATPQMPKRWVLAFGITPNTQHTNCNTLPAPHRPVLLPGSSLASFGKSPAARRNQDVPTTPPKRRSLSGGNGTWDLGRSWWSHQSSMARGLLGSRALTRRSSTNATCSTKNQATQKSQYVPKRKAFLPRLPFCAFDEGFKGP
jgi:hypothetical protein